MKYNHKLFVITTQPEVTRAEDVMYAVTSDFMDPSKPYSKPEVHFSVCPFQGEFKQIFEEGGNPTKVINAVNDSLERGECSIIYVADSVEKYKKIIDIFGSSKVVNIVIEESLTDRFKKYVDTIDYSSDETCLKCIKHFLNSTNKYAKHQTSKAYKKSVEEGRVFKYRETEDGKIDPALVDSIVKFIASVGGYKELA
jgi:hypothetical protein